MEQPNAFDLLLDYPKKRGLVYDTQDDYRRFYSFSNDSMADKKFILFKSESLFFLAFDSYAAKMSMTNTFTGLFGVASPNVPELRIYKKNIADIFLRKNKRKTGFDHIDNNLTITSTARDFSFHLSPPAVNLFLKMSERFSPLHLLVENNYLPNIAELKDKKVIGLQTDQWLFKEEDVEEFLREGSEVLKLVTRD